MKYWVGVTDNTWFNYQNQHKFDEVNFWQPSATPPFKNAQEGMPFLFKLKKPNNHIAGGAFFVTYSTLPMTLAWDVFGAKNGADSLNNLKVLIDPLANGSRKDNLVGCTILTKPFFFSQENWIPTPASFALNIVRGKMYNSEEDEGRQLWMAVQERLTMTSLYNDIASVEIKNLSIKDEAEKYGKPYLAKPRLGQGAFRLLVTDAYHRRCAITGESTLPVLEAAHIVPYAQAGTHEVSNGLLLRADFHKLFDAGLVTVTPDMHITISPQIREAWFNGKAYYRLQGQPLASIPDLPAMRPNPDFLDWHNKNRFIYD